MATTVYSISTLSLVVNKTEKSLIMNPTSTPLTEVPSKKNGGAIKTPIATTVNKATVMTTRKWKKKRTRRPPVKPTKRVTQALGTTIPTVKHKSSSKPTPMMSSSKSTSVTQTASSFSPTVPTTDNPTQKETASSKVTKKWQKKTTPTYKTKSTSSTGLSSSAGTVSVTDKPSTHLSVTTKGFAKGTTKRKWTNKPKPTAVTKPVSTTLQTQTATTYKSPAVNTTVTMTTSLKDGGIKPVATREQPVRTTVKYSGTPTFKPLSTKVQFKTPVGKIIAPTSTSMGEETNMLPMYIGVSVGAVAFIAFVIGLVAALMSARRRNKKAKETKRAMLHANETRRHMTDVDRGDSFSSGSTGWPTHEVHSVSSDTNWPSMNSYPHTPNQYQEKPSYPTEGIYEEIPIDKVSSDKPSSISSYGGLPRDVRADLTHEQRDRKMSWSSYTSHNA